MKVLQYLQYMVKHDASDVFISSGSPVLIKVKGRSSPANKEHIVTVDESKDIAYSLMNEHQIKLFEENLSISVGVSIPNLGRFRVSVFRQRGSVALVIRNIKTSPSTLEELKLPVFLGDLMFEKRGLILVAGATGSGKSSTLAAMIDHRNTHVSGHILTIEDPIEYLFSYKKSIVNQREVHIDATSYANALRSAMREAPDVIMIGEIRDMDTMKQAIIYSETGHLCLATIHASNAIETLDRVINFFNEANRTQTLMDLSRNLRTVVCQRLVKTKLGGLAPALEIFNNSSYFSELIQKGKVDELSEAFDRNTDKDTITFDQSLIGLYQGGVISADEAMMQADSKHNVEVQIRLESNAVNINDDWQVDS